MEGSTTFAMRRHRLRPRWTRSGLLVLAVAGDVAHSSFDLFEVAGVAVWWGGAGRHSFVGCRTHPAIVAC